MTHEPASHDLDSSHRRIITDELRLHEAVRAVVAESVPYFAHMRVQTGGRTRDLLLGWRTAGERGVFVIDWQNAPLAQAFFECGEGDEYEVEVGDSTLSGTLLQRRLVSFERGELVEIVTPQVTLSRRRTGAWTARAHTGAPLLTSRPESARAQRSSPAAIQLDAAQLRAVTRPRHTPVLILGEAGCGKTTVALHRLALLAEQAAGAPFRAAVIVPSEGLRRFTEMLLERMELPPGVEVWLYDRWAAAQARAVFEIPQRESRDATAAVIRLKRHAALRPTLAHLAAARKPKKRGRASRSDLLHLFGDSALLERIAADAAGAFTARALHEVLAHTKVQFSRSTERELADVDADRLKTVDGRAIDDGTPTQDAGTIDAEDYAILFELDRLRSPDAPTPLPRTYDCIVVDEAQELAPLELALIRRALAPDGSLIVAGDHAQQVDPSACFVDWQTTMTELGAAAHDTITLEVSYRCPPEVTALARCVREGRRESEVIADSPALARLRPGNECHLVATLTDALRDLHGRDPWATIAVICHTPEAARRMARLLGRGLTVRLALNGDFAFDAGINVTCVPEIKGLEFDYVVVPDASAAVYPDEPGARNGLYVTMTRAVHQLVLASVGSTTPLLAAPAER